MKSINDSDRIRLAVLSLSRDHNFKLVQSLEKWYGCAEL